MVKSGTLLVIIAAFCWSSLAQTTEETATETTSKCLAEAEPFVSLTDKFGFTIQYNQNGTMACFGENSNKTTSTCCDYEETRKVLQKITEVSNQQWQTYLQAVNAFFEKAVPLLQAFLNNYDIVVQTFNRAPYETYKYLPINLSNRKHFNTLRDYFKEGSSRLRTIKESAKDCYGYFTNLKAGMLCELCRPTATNVVSKNDSVPFGNVLKISSAPCDKIFTMCYGILRANFYSMALVNLYLTYANLKYGTSLPIADPNAYFSMDDINSVMNSLISCGNLKNADCKEADRYVTCGMAISAFGVNPFSEGSASIVNQMLQILNLSTPLNVPTASDSTFLKYTVKVTTDFSVANPIDSTYVDVVNSTSDSVFKLFTLNTSVVILPKATSQAGVLAVSLLISLLILIAN